MPLGVTASLFFHSFVLPPIFCLPTLPSSDTAVPCIYFLPVSFFFLPPDPTPDALLKKMALCYNIDMLSTERPEAETGDKGGNTRLVSEIRFCRLQGGVRERQHQCRRICQVCWNSHAIIL